MAVSIRGLPHTPHPFSCRLPRMARTNGGLSLWLMFGDLVPPPLVKKCLFIAVSLPGVCSVDDKDSDVSLGGLPELSCKYDPADTIAGLPPGTPRCRLRQTAVLKYPRNIYQRSYLRVRPPLLLSFSQSACLPTYLTIYLRTKLIPYAARPISSTSACLLACLSVR